MLLTVERNELFFQLALTQVPGIGHVHAKLLAQHFGSAEAIFKARPSQLERIEGIGSVRAKALAGFNNFAPLEKEISFIRKYGLRPLFLTDPAYPQRLLQCYDPPTLLFYKGEADLNASRMIAIIGTRSNTSYGRQVTEQLVKDLESMEVTIVSGLAIGIDAIAHKSAVQLGMPTIGVLAHGLSTIYPGIHSQLARNMIAAGGGLLTEFSSQVKPDKHNFPVRNRIVAGICDATIVIETGLKGGSMITAELANGYNKDVFAFPGKTTDAKSEGCNHLIRTNKAVLLTGADQLTDIMGWATQPPRKIPPQKVLFHDLTAAEKRIVELLQERNCVHIDQLTMHTGISSSDLAVALLNLELHGLVRGLPGRRYELP